MPIITRVLPHPPVARGNLIQRITLWAHLWRSRRTLARLDYDLLEDLGLTAQVADREASKPFWRI